MNMNNRKYVYAFINAHGTVSVVNYDATNNILNSFLHMFDVWGGYGQFKPSIDNNHQEVWFECGKDFWNMLINPIFNTAFKRMGVTLTFDYPYNT